MHALFFGHYKCTLSHFRCMSNRLEVILCMPHILPIPIPVPISSRLVTDFSGQEINCILLPQIQISFPLSPSQTVARPLSLWESHQQKQRWQEDHEEPL
jgi:hypothetical protein